MILYMGSEGRVVIKGTKMIVITKNKIAVFLSLAVISALCALGIYSVTNNNIAPTFSQYEAILKSEILPAYQKEGKKEKEELSISQKTVKRFFGFVDDGIKKEEITPSPIPEKEEKAELIHSEKLTIDKGIKVSNATSYDVNPVSCAEEKLAFSIDDSGPQILIMHTHTTESYSEESYQKGAPDRNLDENKNMVAVGNAMREVFEKNGISTIHDKTVHDYPSYNSAYQKAAATINKNLQKHKSIKVVLDVHRDAVTRDDGTKIRLLTKDGNSAQIMLVVGTDVNLEHPHWRENFKFASKIQARAQELCPSLMRPIDIRQERFNEQLTYGSLIVEVGANGNTINEAILGAQNIAEVVSKVLKEGK